MTRQTVFLEEMTEPEVAEHPQRSGFVLVPPALLSSMVPTPRLARM